MSERLLRLRQVQELVPLSRSAIYNRIAAGTFPRPISLGPKAIAFIGSEIDAWIVERVTEHRSINGQP